MKFEYGELWITNGDALWRMERGERSPNAEEFMQQTYEAAAFLDGFQSGADTAFAREECYVQGDWHEERTHIMHLPAEFGDAARFAEALQKWLGKPRRKHWRAVIRFTESRDRAVIVYPRTITFSPRFADYRSALTITGN